jgi:hypothetical protein
MRKLSPDAKITVERRGQIVLIGINRPQMFNRIDDVQEVPPSQTMEMGQSCPMSLNMSVVRATLVESVGPAQE